MAARRNEIVGRWYLSAAAAKLGATVVIPGNVSWMMPVRLGLGPARLENFAAKSSETSISRTAASMFSVLAAP